MNVDIVSIAERPDLTNAHWHLTDLWPGFMIHDPIADLYFSRLEDYSRHVFLGIDGNDVVARAFAVPFAMGADVGRPDLPASGWDGAIRWSWLDHLAGRPATHLSALEITVAPPYRGTGLAARMIEALKGSARQIGVEGFVAPVRPSHKHEEPRTSMATYAGRMRSDGLPADPWLRLHVRLGGRIHSVCAYSMTIAGSLTDWRTWSGRDLTESGIVELDGALAPLHVDVEQGHAVYVEPNVWVVHDL